jgi:hypothetical protein
MTTLLTIDPGVHGCGWAFWREKTLIQVGYTPEQFFRGVVGPGRAIIERPIIYPRITEKKPNDLLDLREVVGWVRCALELQGWTVETIFPADWKGQQKKPPNHLKVWSYLTIAERLTFARGVGSTSAAVEDKIEEAAEYYAKTRKVRGYSWQAHNVLDAVGIGLNALGPVRL